MRTPQSIRSLFLTSALVVASLPGCQGEEPSPGESPEALGASTQELCGNLVPVMTSATAPSGIVTRSGAYASSYEAWQAFDATGTMWISAENQTPAWIGYEWTDGPRTITRYAIHFNNGSSLTTRAPKQWTFEGWNGASWVVLDTRTSQTGWLSTERREYTVASPGAYARYRLNITDDNDTRTGVVVISMNRLELYGCASDASLWTRTSWGLAGESLRHNAIGSDLGGRTYAVGFNTGGAEGNPLIGVMDAHLIAREPNGTKLWAKQLGAPGELTVGEAVALNSTGEEIFAAGFTSASLDGAPLMGNRDAFLTKYRYTGVRQWTRQIGTAGFWTEAYAVAVDGAGNAFLVGNTDGGLDGNVLRGEADAFVVKYDSAGNKLWTRQFGATGVITTGRAAAADSAGNVYVSGWTEGALDGQVRMGSQDLFIVKYDASGTRLWTRQLGSTNNGVWLYGSTVDPAGNVYVAGYSGGGLDPSTPATSGSDAYVVKYDPAGNRLWARELSSSSGVWARGVVVNGSGVFVAGSGKGDVGNPSGIGPYNAHNYVAKFDLDGNRQWVIQQAPAKLPSGADTPVMCEDLAMDPSGNFYLGGYTGGSFDGNTIVGRDDGFVTKLAAR